MAIWRTRSSCYWMWKHRRIQAMIQPPYKTLQDITVEGDLFLLVPYSNLCKSEIHCTFFWSINIYWFIFTLCHHLHTCFNFLLPHCYFTWLKLLKWALSKGQLNSEWIYEVIVSPKIQTKNYKDFCSTKQTRIVALFLVILLVRVSSFFWLRSLFVW